MPTGLSATTDVALADLTTLRVGGKARQVVSATTQRELIDVVTECDSKDEPVLVIGGGSNLVVADEGFEGTVVRVETQGIAVDDDSCGGVVVTVAAGESWSDFVARAVAEGWVGVEALAGIPGAVGATPMQNVGAYGQEVSQTIWHVRAYDRFHRKVVTFANADCEFGYRSSRFKGSDRYVILDVSYQLQLGSLSAPIQYAQLARSLDVTQGDRAPLSEVTNAVLALRRSKGMVLDPSDHDSWSAGSFFTNPILPTHTTLPDGAPRWDLPGDLVKTSAAWLIEHAGFTRGYAGPGGRVSLSHKHTLAITNRGHGTAADVLALAREIRKSVAEKFGITLTNEPVLVGCTL